MNEAPVTGIEVTCGFPDSTKAFAEALHKLHLDKVNEWLLSVTHLLVTIDGVEQEIPAKGAHILPCAPGEHDFSCALLSAVPFAFMAKEKARWFNMATLRVPVQAGQIVSLRYMHDNVGTPIAGPNTNAHLEILGVRSGAA